VLSDQLSIIQTCLSFEVEPNAWNCPCDDAFLRLSPGIAKNYIGNFQNTFRCSKGKGCWFAMLRLNHEICVSGFRAKRRQNPASIFSETGIQSHSVMPQYAA
jgi:hypothetical protein